MKNIFLTILAVLPSIYFAQETPPGVSIGKPEAHESAILEVALPNKGFVTGYANLTDLESPNPFILSTEEKKRAEGLLIYNNGDNIPKGYYYWDGNKWNLLGNATESYTNTLNLEGWSKEQYLGYKPKSFDDAIKDGYKLPENHTPITSENGNTYVLYKNSMSWGDAFKEAKTAGGYLVTITTLDEWEFIKNKVLKDVNNANVWLGYNKVQVSGNPTLYRWITNERSKFNWGINTTAETPWKVPTSYDLGCGYINTVKGDDSEIFDIAKTCTDTNYFIIEFDK